MWIWYIVLNTMMFMKKIEFYSKINQLIHKIGFDIRRFPTRDQRMLIKYLKHHAVNDCFDVGANTGQYATVLRSIGFKGKIFSFEPQKKAFDQLNKTAAGAVQWQVYNIALGNTDGKSVINISKNSVSSSILDINQLLVDTAPDTNYISKENIQIKRLDSFVNEMGFNNRLFLKIDAQGFESKILEGAEGFFKNIYALQVELSCISLYKGEKLLDEMKLFIESKGFYLSSLESGFADPQCGRLLQVEAIFLREA
jgi:FkbM family methyltransferase